jgi:hypothetical protein
MEDLQDALRRSVAAAAAAGLTREGGENAIALMARLGLLEEEEGAPPPASRPGWIGIWEPRSDGTSTWFERSRERFDRPDAWADIPRLDLKGAKKRVVLIGESVARGFFYDPQYTPAQVLQSLLAEVPGGIEVIDLARSGLDATGLADLLTSSLALAPDAFVVFAGNNWGAAPPVFPPGLERQAAATLLRERGVAGLAQLNVGKLLALVEGGAQVALGMLAQRVPLFFVLPEFNLADWRVDLEGDAPWLPGDGNERWLRLHAEARAALEEGRLVEAAARAGEMVELDGGLAATGLTLLAEAHLRAGRPAAARALLEQARDTHFTWDSSMQVPRILSPVQDALRRAAGQGAFSLVDLPRVFAEDLGGALPGRELFLDYCHLSSRGIRLAMAAVAEQLLPRLGGIPADRGDLLARAPEPAPEVEAEARLGAAIQNAHWGQGDKIVRHHCRCAAASPKVARLMREYAELQIRTAPAWACAAAERMLAQEARSLFRYVFWMYQWREEKLFDPVLLEAIAGSLEGSSPADGGLDSLRREERGLEPGRPVNLLTPYYQTSWAERERVWSDLAYFRSYAPVARFPFASRAASPVEIRITCRRPPGEEPAEALVRLNGEALQGLPITDRWQTWRIAATVPPGVSWIEIAWPLRLTTAESALEKAAREIERGLPHCLLPVFGEIHTFRVAAV